MTGLEDEIALETTDTEVIFGPNAPDETGAATYTARLEDSLETEANQLLRELIVKPSFSNSLSEVFHPWQAKVQEFYSQKISSERDRISFLILLFQFAQDKLHPVSKLKENSHAVHERNQFAETKNAQKIKRKLNKCIWAILAKSAPIEERGLQAAEELYISLLIGGINDQGQNNSLHRELLDLELWPVNLTKKYADIRNIITADSGKALSWDVAEFINIHKKLLALITETNTGEETRLSAGLQILVEALASNFLYVIFLIKKVEVGREQNNRDDFDQLIEHANLLLKYIPSDQAPNAARLATAIAFNTRQLPLKAISRFGDNTKFVASLVHDVSQYVTQTNNYDETLELRDSHTLGPSIGLDVPNRELDSLYGSSAVHTFLFNLRELTRATSQDEFAESKEHFAARTLYTGIGAAYLQSTRQEPGISGSEGADLDQPTNHADLSTDERIGLLLLSDSTDKEFGCLTPTEYLNFYRSLIRTNALPNRLIPREIMGILAQEFISLELRACIKQRCQANPKFLSSFTIALAQLTDEKKLASLFCEPANLDSNFLLLLINSNPEFAIKICSLDSKNRIIHLLAKFNKSGTQTVSPSFDVINMLWQQTSNGSQGNFEHEMMFIDKLFPEENGFQLQQVILQNSHPLEPFKKILFRLFQRLVEINPAEVESVLWTSNQLNILTVSTLTSLERDPEWTIPVQLRGVIGTQLLVNGVEKLTRGQGQTLFGKNNATYQTAIAQRLNPIIEAGYYDLAKKGSRNPEQLVKSYFDYLDAFGCLDQAGKVVNPEMEDAIVTFSNHWLATIDDYSKISTMFYGRGQLELVDRLIGNYLLAHCNEFNDENEQDPAIYWEKFPHWMWEEEPFNQLRPETLQRIEQALRERNSDGECEKHLEEINRILLR